IQPGFLVLVGFGSTATDAPGDGDALGVGLGAGGACARNSPSDGPPGSGAVGPIPRCASEYDMICRNTGADVAAATRGVGLYSCTRMTRRASSAGAKPTNVVMRLVE